jgi:hypothetical protein
VRASRPCLPRLLLALGLLLGSLIQPTAALGAEPQDEIFSQTARLRELAPKADVPFAVVDAEALRKDLVESYNESEAVRETDISRKLLVMLGLLSPDADLHGMLVDLYAENVLGYYNQVDKKMYLVSGKSNLDPGDKVTLAHEYTHALQDQYFDLGKLQEGLENNSDRSLAVDSLIEGDATLSMIIYARTYLTPDELAQYQSAGGAQSSIDRAPLVVRDEVVFPYNEGALFAVRLWQAGGFEAVNSAFRDPPSSTEQIIHPEKYQAHEQPIEVTLPDLAAALGAGWSQLRTDVLGELDVRIMVEQFAGPAVAARSAEGWGGDRYAYLENASGQQALALSTVWDSEADASEFYKAYADVVGSRFGSRARRTVDAASKSVWVTPAGAIQLQRWGARVALTLAPDESAVEKLATSIGGPVPAASQAPEPAQAPAPAQVPR